MVLELIAIALAIPGSLAALERLLVRRAPRRGRARALRSEPGGDGPRPPTSRTTELAITVRLRLRRP